MRKGALPSVTYRAVTVRSVYRPRNPTPAVILNSMRRAALTFSEPAKAGPYAEALRQAGIEPVLISPGQPARLDGLDGLLLTGGTRPQPCALRRRAPSRQRAAGRRTRRTGNRAPPGRPWTPACRCWPSAAACNCSTWRTAERSYSIWITPPSMWSAGTIPPCPPTKFWSRRIPAWPPSWAKVCMPSIPGTTRPSSGSAPDSRSSARSTPDGVVEALERTDLPFAVAVQWHPEDQVRRDPSQKKLFAAFGAALRQG